MTTRRPFRIRRRAVLAVVPLLLTPVLLVALLGAGEQPKVASPHGPLKADCAQCHGTENWNYVAGRGFDHKTTGYALEGAHAAANCDGCHGDLRFGRVASSCADCHTDVHAGELGFDCAACHTPHDWEPDDGPLALHAARGFPLVGVHARVDCEACHRGAQGESFAGTPSDCFACHAADYQSTTNPDHEQAGMSTDCLNCHSSVAPGWGDSNFDHNAFFALNGAHAALDCAACHKGSFGGEPTTCVGCHQSDYDGTTDPNHAAAGFDTECMRCHNTKAWEPATFDHNATDFPLTGAHATTSCLECHGSGYAGTPTSCYACHQSDFENTNDPDHVASGFDTSCELCHSTTAWEPATFDHAATDFPLTGAHATTSCLECHGSGYAGTPTSCYACHQSDFEGASDPDHVASGFETTCEVCHSTTAWEPATFDHAATDFPLTGAHATTSCLECHGSGYAGTPTSCYACHQSDFENTNDPDHVASGFETTCEVCHSTTAWEPATFDHAATDFPLTGAHTSTSCTQCHSGGYTGTPTDCYACHQSDYDATNDPDHQAAGFNTQCEACHSTSRWSPSTWDHDTLFPIYTGKHSGKWDSCADCHVQQSDYGVFECIFCHEHNRNDTDSHHPLNDIPDYVYESAACFDCHPRGRAN